MILGPTFEEMLHPETIKPHVRCRALEARSLDALDPVALFNITWRDARNDIRCLVLPRELTGVESPIVVLYASEFPTGSHKVGVAYSTLASRQVLGQADPRVHTLVWPSTGNYGIGGAWVGLQMGYQSIVLMRVGVSHERFRLLEDCGALVIKTPGSISNTREIGERAGEMCRGHKLRILNQFEAMDNYRFHYYVTGNTLVELAYALRTQGIGQGRIAAFCSGMGSAGTIAAGDRLKQAWPELKIVGLEPIQCSTLYNNGYGPHGIHGIADQQVAWIHNVMNMDAIACVDDVECKKGLQSLVEEPGLCALSDLGVPETQARKLSTILGVSGVCNILGAIKTAKFYGFGPHDVIATVCTDGIEHYYSSLADLTATYGKMDKAEASVRLRNIFHGQNTDWIREGTREMRRQWHNLKYHIWVEQQGKSVRELDAQLDPGWWLCEQAQVAEIDRRIEGARRW